MRHRQEKWQLSCADLMGELIGSQPGPADTSSNKDYLTLEGLLPWPTSYSSSDTAKYVMQHFTPESLSPLLIIDGFNVLHAGVLVGRDRADWWKETAQRRLVDRVEQFSHDNDTAIWIVFDRR